MAPFVGGMENSTTLKFINNCYWSADGSFRIDDFKSIEEWRKATGQEIYNGRDVGLFADPFLVNPAEYKPINNTKKLGSLDGYKLQPHSPLINAGLDVRSLFENATMKFDYFGTPVPQQLRFDIGACEFKR